MSLSKHQSAHAFIEPTLPVNIALKNLSDSNGAVKLDVLGKGSVAFEVRSKRQPLFSLKRNDNNKEEKANVISLLDGNKKPIVILKVTDQNVCIVGDDYGEMFGKDQLSFDIDLVHFKSSSFFLWVSVNKDENGKGVIKFGCGYMMDQCRLATFTANTPKANEMLSNITYIQFDKFRKVISAKVLKLPVTVDLSPVLATRPISSMDQFNQREVTQISSLPREAEQLYKQIKDLSCPIEESFMYNYSCQTDGCLMNRKLQEKNSSKFGVNNINQTYIRLPVGIDRSQSTGNPIVYEFWPIGHYSPIHSHGNTIAVIKVLHGEIKCILYNQPLVEQNDVRKIKEIKMDDLHKDDITWMTSECYQTHKLENINRVTLAITVQAYMYPSSDREHHETFDYITEGDGKLKRFKPKSDFPNMTFEEFKATIVHEYTNREKREYEIVVNTSTKGFSGTDANVMIIIYGEYGKSDTIELSKKKSNHLNKFEKGQEDVFKGISLPTLGKLLGVKVWHNNKGFGSGWHLESISIVDRKTDIKYHFSCGKWLDAKSGDRQISRNLWCDDVANSNERLRPLVFWDP